MNRRRGKHHFWMPTSLGARGVVLILLVAVSIGLPGFLAGHLLHQQTQQRFGHGAEAFLAVALRSYLMAAAAATPNCDEWVERLVDQNERVRWAGVFDEKGEGFEFRRLTSLRREQIVEQIAFDADGPRLRPLLVRGRPSRQFYLLSVPQPDRGATLAAVVDLGDGAASDTTPLLLVGLGCATVAGLVLALAWFTYAIERPIRSLGRWVTAVQQGLTETALDNVPPAELRELMRSVEETREALKRSLGQAGELRHSLEQRVEAKTRRAERELRCARREADTDALTGLRNRRAVQRELPGLFKQHASEGRELTVVLFDVDRFKILNDTLGHQAGDELLTFLGGLIQGTVRKQADLAARYGGDEFLLVLPDTSVSEAETVARRVHALYMQRVRTVEGIAPPPGLSIGIAALRQHCAWSWKELLDKADTAMYRAKADGALIATPDGARPEPDCGGAGRDQPP